MKIYKIKLNNLTVREHKLLELYLIELGYYFSGSGDEPKTTIEWVRMPDVQKIEQFVSNFDYIFIEILDTKIVDF